MTPYTITTPSGKKVRVTGTKCLIINNIHQHTRVVHLCDQMGINFDIISLVLDAYRSRLTDLPKPCVPTGYDWGRWRARSTRRARAHGVFTPICALPAFTTDMLSWQSGKPVPHGYKCVYRENLKLIVSLKNTRPTLLGYHIKKTEGAMGWSGDARFGLTGTPISVKGHLNMKRIEKEM